MTLRVNRPARRGLALLRILSPLALIALWQLFVEAEVFPRSVLAAPTDVVAAAVELSAGWELQLNLLASIGRVTAGLALGALLGYTLGVLSGVSLGANTIVDPVAQLLRPIPAVALLSIVALVFGVTEAGKIALISYGAFFPVYLSTFNAVRGFDPKLLEVAAVLGLNRWRTTFGVILKGTREAFLAGLRFSATIAWITLVVVEQLNATTGLGRLTFDGQRYFRSDIILLCIVLYGLLGLLTDSLVTRLEALTLPWRRQVKGL